MRNTGTRYVKTDNDALAVLLAGAKNEVRKACALAVSLRLEALAIHISTKEMNGHEAAELLRREAGRVENESLEWH